MAHDGGGIHSDGSLTVSQTTLSGNSSTSVAGGGGIFNHSGFTSLQSTIVANSPSGGDCAGVVTSNGHSLADDNSCGLTAQGDQSGTVASLRPLGDYGGPVKTFALRPSSAAVDAGFADGTTTDQRGRPRTVNYPGVPMAVGGDNSDIGSFELGKPGTTPTRTRFFLSGDALLGGRTDLNTSRTGSLTPAQILQN
jgi:hypothetical protein